MNQSTRLALMLLVSLATISCDRAPERTDHLPPAGTAPQHAVRLGYLRIGSDLPYFVGVDKGIFAKHGLAVQGERFGDSNQVVQALVDGKIDATDITGSSVVLGEAVGRPGAFTIFMSSSASASSDIHQLIARKGAGINKPADLVNKRLAVFPGSQMRVYAELVLEALIGPAFKSVELVPLTPPQQEDAVRSKQVDAVLALEPTGTSLVVAGLGDRIASNILYEYVSKPMPFVTAFGIINNAWRQANPDAARALIDAYREIAAYIERQPADARQVMVRSLGIDSAVAQQSSVYDYTVAPALDRAAIAASVKLMVDRGVLKGTPDLTKLVARDR